MVDLIEELAECCRDATGKEFPDHANPWSIDCGLIRKAIARIRDLERIEAGVRDKVGKWRKNAETFRGYDIPPVGLTWDDGAIDAYSECADELAALSAAPPAESQPQGISGGLERFDFVDPALVVPWLAVIYSEFLPDEDNLGRRSDIEMRAALDYAMKFVASHRQCQPDRFQKDALMPDRAEPIGCDCGLLREAGEEIERLRGLIRECLGANWRTNDNTLWPRLVAATREQGASG